MIEHVSDLRKRYRQLGWIHHHVGQGINDHAADAFTFTQVIQQRFDVAGAMNEKYLKNKNR